MVDGPILRPYIVYNLAKEYIEGIGTVRVGTQCCGRAVEQKRPWIVADMLTDPLFADGRDGAVASTIRAGFSVPVVDRGVAVASLACHYTAPHCPTELDIERNEVFAKLIGIALRAVESTPRPETVFHFSVEKHELTQSDAKPSAAIRS